MKSVSFYNVPRSVENQSEPLRCGIQQAKEDGLEAAMVILADQPFITTLLIDEMITCMRDTPSRKFIATSHDDTISPPVLFSSAMYAALLNLTGDDRSKELLKVAYQIDGKQLPCADKRLVVNIDTAEEYTKLLSLLEA